MSKKKQFKFIGVRPLKGCAPNIRKVLKEDTTYFLYNNYEVDSEDPNSVKPRMDFAYLNNLFCLPDESSPLISVSAIVGKNGDGKSTIIETIMRVLNNFAYASGFLKDQKELQPVKDLYAIIYYSIGNDIYYIKSEGTKIETNFLPEVLNIDEPKQDFIAIEKFESIFFYTQISNYSLYAYNSNELTYENAFEGECWINGIFHKNDAYQTPIVLNPWRNDGNIDINKENNLSKQRLVSLFVNDDEEKSSIREINNKQIAKYLIFHPYDKTKLALTTYEDYFVRTVKTKKDMLRNLRKDLLGYGQNRSKRNYETLNESHISVLRGLKEIIEKNLKDFEFALVIANEANRTESTSNNEDNAFSDFESYLVELTQIVNRYIGIKGINCEEALSLISFFENTGFNQFNILQLQRVFLVLAIKQLWNEKLINAFNQNAFYRNDNKGKALQYIVYKTIAIFQKYPQYKAIEKISILEDFNSIFEYSSKLEDYVIEHREYFEKLQVDISVQKSHVSLKLRQTLNFISSNKKYISAKDINKELIKSLKISNDSFPEDSFIIDFQDYKKRLAKNRYGTSNDVIEFLPPPIFNVDVIFQKLNNNKECSFLSNLSSGERQLLNNVSSVIYHLQNINSVRDSGLVKYKHVNLIFEEIELYFHPEYQRRYISSLIKLIGKARLDKLESINICFVTHSPFILSDIPLFNILRLKDGKPETNMNSDQNTFGANIHDLLANEFFMENGFMGEFAKDKLNEVINSLRLEVINHEISKIVLKENNVDETNLELLSNERIELINSRILSKLDCEKIISFVGEPVLYNSLMELYSQAYPTSKNDFINQQIKLLQKLIIRE